MTDKKSKVNEVKVLSNVQMLELENNRLKIVALENAVKALDFKKQAQALLFDKEIGDKMKELQSAKVKKVEYQNKIKDELGIESDHWGYDTVTGEIKE